ncbi:molybdopterin-dependent oxidoreductase [Salinibacterium sp. NK8237]|uniref:molybdopterin-dependent oxidoreductase n=1 Tax=Salinibacterium sp. NK8237 TaxID=2792038 RepID=UPI0018CE4B0F|nr:molybdopterin-dependent oxidoreductase [Salinibacterium sp. NK8237]MBH0130175.1 molybdopterin-dependent oxidoreductase [Salinibacterium sp. NK8237]
MTSATKTAPPADLSVKRIRTWSALLGVLSAAVVLAVAEFFAVFISPASSPVLAVGSLVIDLAPSWLKDLTIALFGTNDKIVLLLCVGLLVLILAVAIGLAEYARPSWGVILLVFVGVIATIAVTTRAQATASWPMPTVLGVVAGVLVLRLTMIRLRRWVSSTPVAPATTRAGSAEAARAASAQRSSATPARVPAASRRDFLRIVGVTSIGAVLVGAGARVVNASASVVDAVRTALTLPAAAFPAPAIPAGASLEVAGISPIITPNADFYRIDTALVVPNIDADEWSLKITGMVENEIEITFAELLALPLVETAATLSCVSNVVGGDLVDNAMWLGYPIRELLAQAKPLAGADMVLSRSIDGFTASTPIEALQEESRESILAVGMNGEPLPREHGFPVRMVVPGLYGYVSATKWVVEMEVTRFADATAYWTDRGWSAIGPVKVQSRIDVPSSDASVEAGTVAVAGVAWAPNTGIAGVEVRVDSGTWEPAELATAISVDTWVQWVYEWEATSGNHIIEVRATDAEGTTQSGDPVPVVPDGAEGWHRIGVQVA